MSKYRVLVSILDKIRDEACGLPIESKYLVPSGDEEKINQARARAYIHLYLMVSFGILDFAARERVITDKGYDGGIDAYYIDSENRQIYLIQSKFRTNDRNFAEKNISPDEIVAMDINRILEGNQEDERGNPYNGKIKQLIREVSQIPNIGRYNYTVILLANTADYTASQKRKLFDNYPVQIFDHERCYRELVFPVVSGTFFKASELHIYLDLSNKNAGSKISYEVKTAHGDCQITVLFVPTIEIAKTLSKYKNSILQHNPRSYLELEGKKVNGSIRETIAKKDTNEFALFNNGITMISDSTGISERIGQKSKAQLAVRNPQIINGGQTAYTLSKMFDEVGEEEAIKLFEGKEVLLKVITLDENAGASDDKIELIDAISTATNQQTAVSEADRVSNEPLYEKLQDVLFSRYGIFFEKKRGEFGDGIARGYIDKAQVLERNQFFRLYYASSGQLTKAMGKKLFLKFENPESVLDNMERLDEFYFAYLCYSRLEQFYGPNKKKEKDFYGRLFVLAKKFRPTDIKDYPSAVDGAIANALLEFVVFVAEYMSSDTRFIKEYLDKDTNEQRKTFNFLQWYRDPSYENEIKKHFRIDEYKIAERQE